jgi:hypothetical protein
MIMLDEFQHFYDKQSHKVMHHVSDWLKLLSDESNKSMVVSGLPSCQAVINQNEQLSGRFLSPIYMPRFAWDDDTLREQFISILEAFQEGLPKFSMPDFGEDEMAFRFYCASGGLIGYVAKILRQAVWNATDCKTKVITLEDLAEAYQFSVYKDENEKKNCPIMAFDRNFSTKVNEELLIRARIIGTPSPEEPRKKRVSSSKIS